MDVHESNQEITLTVLKSTLKGTTNPMEVNCSFESSSFSSLMRKEVNNKVELSALRMYQYLFHSLLFYIRRGKRKYILLECLYFSY